MTLNSMTGFASGQGADDQITWTWDIRSVNAKGLDVRFRGPEWLEGIETAAKKRVAAAVSRGNVNVSLRVQQADDDKKPLRINGSALTGALAALAQIEASAQAAGVTLAPSRATDILSLRGLVDHAPEQQDSAPIVKKLLSEFDSLLAAFVNMRESEGAALLTVLEAQIAEVATLCERAKDRVDARKEQMESSFRTALGRIVENSDDGNEDRIAQELAILAVKADVSEELDRLDAHVAAAQKLLFGGGPIGRKLDFLMQEFNREANTLCSKSQNAGLTEVGLELKTVIDQMREQVQNIE